MLGAILGAVGGALPAAMILTGFAQLYNAEMARGANRKRLEEIKKAYEAIVPPDYDLSIDDPPAMHEERLQMPQFSGPQAGPEWDLKKLEPRQLKIVEKFTPQIAKLIYQKEPTLIEKSETMKMGSAAEKKALRRFMDVGEGEFDPVYQQRVKEARDRTQAEAQARGAAIQQDFARRGIGGSGLELAAKLGTSAQSMDRQAQMGMQAESQAYQNQLRAMSQGADLGGRIQDRDISTQGRNAQIINDFNQRMSKRHQDWEQMRAQQLNAADLRNIQEAQRIAESNTLTQNRYDQAHQRRMDDISMRNYRARIDEMNRQDAIKKWRYGAEGEERAYRDRANLQAAKWRQDQKRYGNRMRGQAYQDQLARISGIAGPTRRQGEAAMQSAADQNAAMQGMMDMYATYDLKNKELAKDNNPNYSNLWASNDYFGGENRYAPKKNKYNLGIKYDGGD